MRQLPVLSWPKNAVVAEEHNQEGYSDYVLKDLSNETAVIIEAKKEGAFFEVPAANGSKHLSEYLKIRTLRTDPVVAAAIDQVRKYCLETGTKYGCITNGNVWVFLLHFPKIGKI
jgi:predicted type IV restriction endonuclease